MEISLMHAKRINIACENEKKRTELYEGQREAWRQTERVREETE